MEPAQRKLLEGYDLLDDAKDRFDAGLAPQIAGATFGTAEFLFHRHQHSGLILTWLFTPLILAAQIIATPLMSFGTDGDIGFNALALDLLDHGPVDIAPVG